MYLDILKNINATFVEKKISCILEWIRYKRCSEKHL